MNTIKGSQLFLRSLVRGFTLLELLMASAMTLVVVTLAGIAVAQVIQRNLQTRGDSQIQYNTNRAAEYISDEVRKAKTVENNTTVEFDKLKAKYSTNTNFDQGMTPVLILDIPGVSEKVVYYTIPRSRVDSETVYEDHRNWLVGRSDSLVLYRWGYDRTQEDAGATSSDKGNPGIWKPQPVLDNVDSGAATGTCGLDPSNPGYSTATPTYLTRVPAINPKGFSACVADSKKFAELRLKASYQEDNDAVNVQKPIEYEVKTQVATRASDAFSLDGPVIIFITPGKVLTEMGGDPPPKPQLYGDSLGTEPIPITSGSQISIPNDITPGRRIYIQNDENHYTSEPEPGVTPTRDTTGIALRDGDEIKGDILQAFPASWNSLKETRAGGVYAKLSPNQFIVVLNNTFYKFTIK